MHGHILYHFKMLLTTIILLDKIEAELPVENGQINNGILNKVACDCIRREGKTARNI